MLENTLFKIWRVIIFKFQIMLFETAQKICHFFGVKAVGRGLLESKVFFKNWSLWNFSIAIWRVVKNSIQNFKIWRVAYSSIQNLRRCIFSNQYLTRWTIAIQKIKFWIVKKCKTCNFYGVERKQNVISRLHSFPQFVKHCKVYISTVDAL